jgi:hypothetical protein
MEDSVNTKKPLRNALKDFLQAQNLTDEEVSRLQQVEQTPEQRTNKYISYVSQYLTFRFGVAAFFLTTMLVVGALFKIQSHHSIQERIAHEVLTNHLKIKALDIETDSIAELQNYFSRLEFSPFFSTQLNLSDFKLLGGRYCTLQGVIASQLRLLSRQGEMVTYYQAHYDEKHFGHLPDIDRGDRPHIIYERGFLMTIWKEKNVVTVLANADHRY